jgi:transcriptional regulator with XRE-family HTH domain
MPQRELPPFGERLKGLREEAGLTQRELAAKAEVSLSIVFQIEQGAKKDPRISTLVALAEALGVSMDELIGWEPEPPEPEPPKKRRPRKGE